MSSHLTNTSRTRCPIHRAVVSRDEWAFAKRTALLLLALAIPALKAQTAPCGITSIKETTDLIYPPIARAAHINGLVIVLATFNQDGTVSATKTIQANKVLRGILETAAISYVKGWQANPYTGPRECPVVIDFRFVGMSAECGTPEDHSQSPSIPLQHPDLQHAVIASNSPCFVVTRDPASRKIHRFHF
jgi:hypothetical protein